jgi:hypothetical protein
MSTVDERFAKLFGANDRLDRLEREIERLPSGGGGGTSGGMTDDWKASVEQRLGSLHDDLRAMLKVGTAAAVALAGMIAGLYFYTDTKFEVVDAKFERVEERLTALQVQQAKSDAKLDLLVERTASKAK